jgi:hypothetical protein
VIARKLDAGGRALSNIHSRDPISLVAAEIHLGHMPAALSGGDCSAAIQVACHNDSKIGVCFISKAYAKEMKGGSPGRPVGF